MSFVLSQEQVALQRTAAELVAARLPITQLRSLRDRQDVRGYSEDAWREMAELGLAAIAIPEDFGGAGLGFSELGLVFEECGRTLAATPLMSTAVLGAGALVLQGTHAQQEALLPQIAAGNRILAFAHEEGTRHAPQRIAARAERTAEGYRLVGEKSFVLDAHVADVLLVVARVAADVSDRDGLSLFLVPREQAGVQITRLDTIDSHNAGRVRLDGVRVGPEALLGAPTQLGQASAALEPLLDRARACLSAEMLGATEEAFGRTIAYLKTRKQFGVAIGSFQALKHRAARMFAEIELLRSVVRDALAAIDEGRPDAPALASAAKARASDTALLVANEAIQMHGGIGVTDELDIGFFLKRARVAAQLFGDANYHRDRFAQLHGF